MPLFKALRPFNFYKKKDLEMWPPSRPLKKKKKKKKIVNSNEPLKFV